METANFHRRIGIALVIWTFKVHSRSWDPRPRQSPGPHLACLSHTHEPRREGVGPGTVLCTGAQTQGHGAPRARVVLGHHLEVRNISANMAHTQPQGQNNVKVKTLQPRFLIMNQLAKVVVVVAPVATT